MKPTLLFLSAVIAVGCNSKPAESPNDVQVTPTNVPRSGSPDDGTMGGHTSDTGTSRHDIGTQSGSGTGMGTGVGSGTGSGTGSNSGSNPTGTTDTGATGAGATNPSDVHTMPADPGTGRAPDNTGVNKRDAGNSGTVTPTDQGNGKSDIGITAEIRRAIVKDGAMSMAAKNVKIITTKGKVTLRGAVNSDDEKSKVEAIARRVAGDAQVDNQLEVKTKLSLRTPGRLPMPRGDRGGRYGPAPWGRIGLRRGSAERKRPDRCVPAQRRADLLRLVSLVSRARMLTDPVVSRTRPRLSRCAAVFGRARHCGPVLRARLVPRRGEHHRVREHVAARVPPRADGVPKRAIDRTPGLPASVAATFRGGDPTASVPGPPREAPDPLSIHPHGALSRRGRDILGARRRRRKWHLRERALRLVGSRGLRQGDAAAAGDEDARYRHDVSHVHPNASNPESA
jgi:hyperosmotically inducible protein